MQAHINRFVIPSVILLCLYGSYITIKNNLHWYTDELLVPELTLPSSIFPVPWYIMAVISLLLIFFFRPDLPEKVPSFSFLLLLQSMLTLAWSISFFSAQDILLAYRLAVGLVITLMLLLGLCIAYRTKVALLIIPILLWAQFALYLTHQVWLINFA